MTAAPEPLGRRRGLSSRMRPAAGTRTPWTSPGGPVIDLPVVFDLVMTDPKTGVEAWRCEATVGIGGDADPALLSMVVSAGPESSGLDTERLQRDFRWATPVEAVTRIAPQMISQGLDPYAEEFPHHGFPDVSRRKRVAVLSDEFLEDIAREYLTLGHGYARTLAAKHSVSPRTVVSWVEKARSRGILSATTPGRAGGAIVPRTRRTPRRHG